LLHKAGADRIGFLFEEIYFKFRRSQSLVLKLFHHV
jgi:hypothetical protein